MLQTIKSLLKQSIFDAYSAFWMCFVKFFDPNFLMWLWFTKFYLNPNDVYILKTYHEESRNIICLNQCL